MDADRKRTIAGPARAGSSAGPSFGAATSHAITFAWAAEHERAARQQLARTREMIAGADLARDAAMRRANDLALAEVRRRRAAVEDWITAEVADAARRARARHLARRYQSDPILAMKGPR